MADEYITQSGDTWDIIAKLKYGSELFSDRLMAANFPALDWFIFPSGVRLVLPEIEKATASGRLPEYRIKD